jgi:3-hydroxyisobutyrate dehydrogenase-like beta-hydroxyacid dehydrogenase
METYGGLVLHLGRSGAGLDAKLALNMFRYIVMAASDEAARLAGKAGVGEALAQLVAHAEANRFTGSSARMRGLASYPAAAREKDAVVAQKDLRAAIDRAATLGLELPAAELTFGLMHRVWGVEPDAK